MKSLRRIAPAVAALALAVGGVAVTAGSASAGTGSAASGTCPDGLAGCAAPGTYHIAYTGGNYLNVHSSPDINSSVVAQAPDGWPVDIDCQVNDGSTDAPEGYYGRTWNLVTVSTTSGPVNGWVYDYFVDTPPENANGWSLTAQCLS